MFVKLENGQVKCYPYTLEMFKQEHRSTSFPSSMSDELLASYDVFRVVELEKPEFNSLTQECVLDSAPHLENGQWVISFKVQNKPESEASSNVRAQRNRLLSSSDWVVISAVENNEPIPQDWLLYRKALKDLPASTGFPYDVAFPLSPDALAGKG
jgi:hypothetical protein